MKSSHIYMLLLSLLLSCQKKPEPTQHTKDTLQVIKPIEVEKKLPESNTFISAHKPDSIPAVLNGKNSYLIKDTLIDSYQIFFINKEYSMAAGGTNALRVAVLQENQIVLDSILGATYGGDLEYSLILEKISYTGHSFMLHEELTDVEKGIDNQKSTKELTFEADFSKLYIQP